MKVSTQSVSRKVVDIIEGAVNRRILSLGHGENSQLLLKEL